MAPLRGPDIYTLPVLMKTVFRTNIHNNDIRER